MAGNLIRKSRGTEDFDMFPRVSCIVGKIGS